MAFGLYVMQDGSVMVVYGQRHIPISCAQYKANGYKPSLEKLAVKSPAVRRRPLNVVTSPTLPASPPPSPDRPAHGRPPAAKPPLPPQWRSGWRPVRACHG